MFNFLKSDSSEDVSYQLELEEVKNRFFVFIEKLEVRMKEFVDDSIPELSELNKSDTDEHKRAFHRMKAAVDGQLSSIRKKASDVMEEKVTSLRTDSINLKNTYYNNFRNVCYERMREFESLYLQYSEQISATEYEDLELAYQKILDEFEEIKNKFTCVQCSSSISIDKIYFTTTYISCPVCHTQNTYEPSSQAKGLEQLGRSLAEQRTAHLLTKYNEVCSKDQELYLQRHKLEISLISEKDKQIIAEKTAKITAIENEKQAILDSRPILYQNYLRAMFDEWNKINPALQEEHEKFYNRLLTDYLKIN